MFTGIINHSGTISSTADLKQGKRFVINTDFTDLIIGESIAVNGVCLTVAEFEKNQFVADVSPETLQLTTFSNLRNGSEVNLERSLQLQDRVNGHFVSGHIDQTAEIKSKVKRDDFIEFTFSGILDEFKKYLVHKGSVSVNGVSLTVNALVNDGFVTMLIPETLAVTNLNGLRVGELVNIEFDMIVKSVARQFELAKHSVN